MPAIALGNGQSSVASLTGTGWHCLNPVTTSSGPGTQTTVFIEGFPPVVQGDTVAPHAAAGCGLDTSGLTKYSSTVFIGGKGVGRIGDQYTGDNTITSGSSTVFIG